VPFRGLSVGTYCSGQEPFVPHQTYMSQHTITPTLHANSNNHWLSVATLRKFRNRSGFGSRGSRVQIPAPRLSNTLT